MADKLQLYPLYIVYRADGVEHVRCVDRANADSYVRKLGTGSAIKLEPRHLESEMKMTAADRARCDAIYSSGVEVAAHG